MSSSDKLSMLDGLEPLFVVAPQKQTVPDNLFSKLAAHVEAECQSPTRSTYEYNLAGRIWNGEQIEGTSSLPSEIKLFLCMVGREYIFRIVKVNGIKLKPDLRVSFIDSWITRSKAGDYNPVH